MSDFIDKLQRKPEHVRRRILLIGSFGSTCLILFIWFFLFAHSLSPTAPAITAQEKADGPFTLIKDSILRMLGRVDYQSSENTNKALTESFSTNDATSTVEIIPDTSSATTP